MRTEQDLSRDQVGQHVECLPRIDLQPPQLADEVLSFERGDLILQQQENGRSETRQRDRLAPLRVNSSMAAR